MIPDNTYYLDEVRDGFFIPSMMKKAWLSAMRDYQELVKVCEDLGISCYATWGTLTGTIRHGGFIPWDDDIDLMIFREDYEKLEAFVGTEERETGFHIQDFTVTLGTNIVRQWLEKSILLYPPECWEERGGLPFGDVIDLFIMDHMSDRPEKRKRHAQVIAACNDLQNYLRETYGNETDKIKLVGDKKSEELIKRAESELGHPILLTGELPLWVQVLEQLDGFLASFVGKKGYDCVADTPFALGIKERFLPIS